MSIPLPGPDDLFHLLILLAIGFCIWVCVNTVLIIRLLRHPQRLSYGWAVAKGLPGDPGEADKPVPYDDWKFRSPRGMDLPAWTLHNEADPDGPTLIICHGWGASRVTNLPLALELLPMTGRIVLWDMPGHGEAAGNTTLGRAEHRDLLALLDSLRGDDFADKPVFLLGSSMGAGIAVAAAAELCEKTGNDAGGQENDRETTGYPHAGGGKLAGVIAVGVSRRVWEPARVMFRNNGLPWRFGGVPALFLLSLFSARPGWFDRREQAARLCVPLLVMTGENDNICPPGEGQALTEVARHGEMVVLPGGEHGRELETSPDLFRDSLRKFISRCVKGSNEDK